MLKRYLPLLMMLCVLTLPVIASACPNCKSSAAVDSTGAQGGGGLPAGFNYSIYFMLGSLFVVLGGVSYVIVKAVRDTNRAGFPVRANPAAGS